MHQRLKEIIFKKLNKDLSKVEIILSENQSIWFIDRANKYWYFELEKSGKLWWRFEFFTDFFPLFCLEVNEFQPLLSEWVEGVLNCGVSTTGDWSADRLIPVKNILNRGVSATLNRWKTPLATVEDILNHGYRKGSRKVDEVLNREVDTNTEGRYNKPRRVDKVLNRKINEIDGGELLDNTTLEKVLNHKVVSILPANLQNDFVQQVLVNELIYEVESATPLDTPAYDSVDEVLNSIVPLEIP